jgi:thiamine pyrophosphate-dependent acetolactate synthase large subunit-like protein
MDSAPVLIISGNEPSRYSRNETRIRGVQGYATAKAARPFVKWSVEAGDPIFTPIHELSIAYKAALDWRQGSAWIDFPRDMFNAVV